MNEWMCLNTVNIRATVTAVLIFRWCWQWTWEFIADNFHLLQTWSVTLRDEHRLLLQYNSYWGREKDQIIFPSVAVTFSGSSVLQGCDTVSLVVQLLTFWRTLQNVGNCSPSDMAPHPRRLHFSATQLWEPQILLQKYVWRSLSV